MAIPNDASILNKIIFIVIIEFSLIEKDRAIMIAPLYHQNVVVEN